MKTATELFVVVPYIGVHGVPPQLMLPVQLGQSTLAALFTKGVPAAFAAFRLCVEQLAAEVDQPKTSLRKLASLPAYEPVSTIRPPLATKLLSAAWGAGPQPVSDPSISVIKNTAAVDSFVASAGSAKVFTLASTR